MKNTIWFSFDYGCCLWTEGSGIMLEELISLDGKVIHDGINNCLLPISKELINELKSLVDEFSTSLDWDYPPDPSPWTKEEFIDFFNRAEIVYEKLKNELGANYTVINKIDDDRKMYMDNREFAPTRN